MCHNHSSSKLCYMVQYLSHTVLFAMACFAANVTQTQIRQWQARSECRVPWGGLIAGVTCEVPQFHIQTSGVITDPSLLFPLRLAFPALPPPHPTPPAQRVQDTEEWTHGKIPKTCSIPELQGPRRQRHTVEDEQALSHPRIFIMGGGGHCGQCAKSGEGGPGACWAQGPRFLLNSTDWLLD